MNFIKRVTFLFTGFFTFGVVSWLVMNNLTFSQAQNQFSTFTKSKKTTTSSHELSGERTFLESQNLIAGKNSPEVVKTNEFRFTKAQTIKTETSSSVDLTWESVPEVTDGYVVQRTNDATIPNEDIKWDRPPTNYGKMVKILNVYPDNCAYLKKWMNQIDPATGQPISMNLISVDEISLETFNKNPEGYLKDSTGKYSYDGIYFGSEDVNGGYKPEINDLNAKSQVAVTNFANTGRSLIFGHDTILSKGHPYFATFAEKVGLILESNLPDGYYADPFFNLGSSKVQFVVSGFLNQYPYSLEPNFPYEIKPAHTVGQFFNYNSGATRWMEFVPPFSSLGEGNKETKMTYLYDATGKVVGDNNWYLVTKNNYAQIQTGHSVNNGIGACTPDEAKVIANMIYYTSTLNISPSGSDHTVKDDAAPDSPTVSLATASLDQVKLTINANDNPTNYYYRVIARTTKGAKYSDVIKVPVLSDIKGYIYQIDRNPSSSLKVERNPNNGEITNLNLYPDSTNNSKATLSLNRQSTTEKYLHLIAVDGANNVSSQQTINLTQYVWWNFDAGVLTIYPHEIDGALDRTGVSGSGSTVNYYWPWFSLTDQITQVVIQPGVTAKGDISGLFNAMRKLQNISGLSNLNTAKATVMDSLFQNCQLLTNLDLSNFDTSQVTSMNLFFYNCSNLKSLDLSNFNTSKLTSMQKMFYYNSSLSTVKFGPNFDTKQVTDFSGLFEGDNYLKNVDVSHFDTRSATTMKSMFSGCIYLSQLDVSNFDTARVTDMDWMFHNMSTINQLDVSQFSTTSLKTMNYMFSGASNLTNLDLSNFDTRNVVSMRSALFNYQGGALWRLKLGPNTILASNSELDDPIIGTKIKDMNLPTSNYYCTNANWQEVASGTDHNPKGGTFTASQVITDSATRHDFRTYVWNQEGRVTFKVPATIEFGQVKIPFNKTAYPSSTQLIQVVDNRNERQNRKWQLNLSATKFVNTHDATKKLIGDPLYYQDASGKHHLTETATVVNEKLIEGKQYQENWNLPYTLIFQAKARDISNIGSYQATVTYTLTDTAGL